MFRDREEAAEKLADALQRRRGSNPLVIAIPRGAVPMGAIVARRLGGALDVVLVRKLGARYDPELAIGAVDETGWTYVAPHARSVGATSAYIESQVARELATIRERRRRYTPDRGPLDPAGRVVIVVDDGLATGSTMRAAVAAIRQQQPARIVVAVPVAAPSTRDELAREVDEIVCVATPEPFLAVGRFYDDFAQTSDGEVHDLLERAARRG